MSLTTFLRRGLSSIAAFSRIGIQTRQRRLRLSETLSLGEKRFVALVEVDGRSLLLGGGPGTVVLLTELQAPSGKEPFANVMQRAASNGGSLRDA